MKFLELLEEEFKAARKVIEQERLVLHNICGLQTTLDMRLSDWIVDYLYKEKLLHTQNGLIDYHFDTRLRKKRRNR